MLFAIGHLGKDILAGVGLALSFCNLTGVVISIGLITVCETLLSQAYGAGNYKKIGVILQRTLLLSTISMFPIIALWLNAEKLMLALDQPPVVCR